VSLFGGWRSRSNPRDATPAGSTEALRLARRAMSLASSLGLPLVTVIDTVVTDLSPAAEEGGTARQVALCLAAKISDTAAESCWSWARPSSNVCLHRVAQAGAGCRSNDAAGGGLRGGAAGPTRTDVVSPRMGRRGEVDSGRGSPGRVDPRV